MRGAFIVGALVAGLAIARPASAQDDMPERRIGVTWVNGVPTLHFSAVDLADAAVRDTLEAGLPQTLVLRIYAYRGSEPIAVTARSCRVLYDLWPQTFDVEVRDARFDRDQTVDSIEGVLQRCLVADRVPVGRAEDYAPLLSETIRFAVVIELNPLSPETLHLIRRWLSQPAGGGRAGGPAFYGSFVGLFVNRSIGAAERTLRFRSQPVEVRP